VRAEVSGLTEEMQSLQEAIFSCLKERGVNERCMQGTILLRVSLLRRYGHYVQRPHTDFKGEFYEQEQNKGRIFIGFTPLTKDGMFLHVWNWNDRRGRLLFVPYGTILLLPGDTLHGGGLCSSSVSRNLRMHFSIFLDGILCPHPSGNEYDDKAGVPYDQSYDVCTALEKEMEKLFRS